MGGFKPFKESKNRGGRFGKIDAPLNQKLQQVKWGEFRIGDLFDISNTLSFNAEVLVDGDIYDYITRTSLNQGILQTTGFVNAENINPAGNWSLGLLQMDFFYRRKPWYAGQFVRKVIPKFAISDSAILFFTTLLNRLKPNLLSVLVRDVDKTFLNSTLQIPITNDGAIDFGFIAEFVAELEAQRVAELATYLQATELKDYSLTEDEQRAITNFDKTTFADITIDSLFDKVKVKSLRYKTSDLPSIPMGEFILPALTAGIQNQGLNNYVPPQNATILSHVISISANGANTGATFFQSKNFTVLQDAYAIRWNDESSKLSDNQYLYMTGAIAKAIVGNYEWTNKAGWERIKSNTISVPINNGVIDFVYMDTLIAAIKKLAIQDVVKFADRKIAATREFIADK